MQLVCAIYHGFVNTAQLYRSILPTESDEELRVVRVLLPAVRHPNKPSVGETQPRMNFIFERFFQNVSNQAQPIFRKITSVK